MFLVLECNNDPMGGGSAYTYVDSFPTIELATEYVTQNTGPWRSYIIAKKMT